MATGYGPYGGGWPVGYAMQQRSGYYPGYRPVSHNVQRTWTADNYQQPQQRQQQPPLLPTPSPSRVAQPPWSPMPPPPPTSSTTTTPTTTTSYRASPAYPQAQSTTRYKLYEERPSASRPPPTSSTSSSASSPARVPVEIPLVWRLGSVPEQVAPSKCTHNLAPGPHTKYSNL